MRCRKLLFTVFLTVFLALTFIQTASALKYYLPKNTTIQDGLKIHFGDYWISTSETDITITSYFIDNWFNYTSNAGTQQIHNGTKPAKIYFDDVEQTEGITWSYSDGTVTVTPSSTNVGIVWAANGVEPIGTRFLFETGGSLGFQIDINRTVTLEVTSGVLNSTAHAFQLSNRDGYFRFTAINDTQITITYEGVDQVFVSGDQNKAQRMIDSDIGITVITGDNVRISWHFLPWSMIDNYFMLGVGLTGIIMLIAGPTIFARTFIKHGLDSESVEWLGYAMLFVVMGFGFLVVWLWPG